jgi:ketosteroid isomerase-like protein
MKKLASAFIALSFAAAVAAPAFAAGPGDELVGMEASWSKALVGKDWAAIRRIVAPDWHGQNQGGKRQDRASMLAELTSGTDRITSMTNHDVTVRLVGDLAIVQGMDNEVSTHKGKSSSGTYGWTDIFQKRGGHWVAIASQNTPISKK